MAVLVNSSVTQGAGNLSPAAFTVTAGNTLIVIAEIDDTTTTPTVGDNNSNSFTTHSASPFTLSTAVIRFYVWYVKSANAGSTTVTVTKGSVASVAYVLEYSGLHATAPEDGSSSNDSGSSTNPSPGAISASAGGIIIGCVADNANPTAGSGYTERLNNSAFNFFSKLEDETTPHTASGSFTPNWTAAANSWGAIGLAFKDAGATTRKVIIGPKP